MNTEVKNIIIFIQNRDFFGALLNHIPLLYSLRIQYHTAKIIIFSPFTRAYSFYEWGLADEIVIQKQANIKLWKVLRQIKADLIITLRPSSMLLNALIGFSGAKKRIGYRSFAGRWLLDGMVERNTDVYRALNYLNLLKPVNVVPRIPDYFVSCAKDSNLIIDGSRCHFCIISGGGAGDFKKWGIENYIKLCQEIIKIIPNAHFYFILGEQEKPYLSYIRDSTVSVLSTLLVNDSIANCAKAILWSLVTIGNDCGPAHIAQLSGVNFVGIYSNESGSGEKTIAEWFYMRSNSRYICAATNEDIKAIPVDKVFEKVEEFITVPEKNIDPNISEQ